LRHSISGIQLEITHAEYQSSGEILGIRETKNPLPYRYAGIGPFAGNGVRKSKNGKSQVPVIVVMPSVCY
jgi:hypothetical protein